KAQAICKKAHEKIETIDDDFAKSPTKEDYEGGLKKVSSLLEGMVKELDGLKPPKDVTKDVDAMLDDINKVVGDIKEKGLEFITSATADPFEAANKKAKDLG